MHAYFLTCLQIGACFCDSEFYAALEDQLHTQRGVRHRQGSRGKSPLCNFVFIKKSSHQVEKNPYIDDVVRILNILLNEMSLSGEFLCHINYILTYLKFRRVSPIEERGGRSRPFTFLEDVGKDVFVPCSTKSAVVLVTKRPRRGWYLLYRN